MAAVILWAIIALLILILVIALAAAMLAKKKKHQPDYYTFFIMGITWIPLGFALKNQFMWGLGIVFMIVGLINKDKWKQNRKSWDKLSKSEKKLRMIIIVALGILVLLGLVLFLLKK